MDDEGEGVPLGHALVGFFGVEGLDEDGVFVELGGHLKTGSGAFVLGLGGNFKGVGLVEAEVISDFVFSADGSLL